MLKMFRDRENGLRGGACRDSAQISRHLEKADTETLVDELMELTERAANGDVNLEQIDAYLDALDEKDPLPFKADSKAALSDFHNRHGLLIKESRAAHQRHCCFFFIFAFFISICADAGERKDTNYG